MTDHRAVSARDGRMGEPTGVRIQTRDGGAHFAWEARDDMAVITRVDKSAAGRLLDGCEWNEFPNTTQQDLTP